MILHAPVLLSGALLVLVASVGVQDGAVTSDEPTEAVTPDGPAEIAALLAAIGPESSPEQRDQQARALAKLHGAPEVFLEVASTRRLPGAAETVPMVASRLDVLLRAAPRFPRTRVVHAVQAGAADHPDRAWRLAALRLLELHGTAPEIPLLRCITLEKGGTAPDDPVLLEAFRTALTRTMRRDPRGPEMLSGLPVSPPPLRVAMCRAIGAAELPGGLEWLGEQLDDPELVGVALQEVSRLAPLADRRQALRSATRIRPLLDREDPGLRKHAMRSLASLQDIASVPRLIELLDAGTRGEGKGALSALRKLSGHELPPEGPVWRSWYEEQQRWLREEGASAITLLTSERDDEVVAAVHALSEHGLFREFVAPELIELLEEHESPTVRAQVCLALARLDTSTARSPLIVALDDGEELVADAAWRALRSTTGLSLPPDSSAWEEALRAP